MAGLEIPALLQTFVDRWSEKYPKLRSRIEAGRQLVLAGKVSPFDATSYRAVGSSKQTYLVRVRHGYISCSCPDHQDRKVKCKHAWAASMLGFLSASLEAMNGHSQPPSIEEFIESAEAS